MPKQSPYHHRNVLRNSKYTSAKFHVHRVSCIRKPRRATACASRLALCASRFAFCASYFALCALLLRFALYFYVLRLAKMGVGGGDKTTCLSVSGDMASKVEAKVCV